MTFYQAIQSIIRSSKELNRPTKREIIAGYESLKEIRVVDSAFPKSLGDFIREEFNISDIGNWSYAYGEVGYHGILVPCDERALALFDVMLADGNVPTFSGVRYEVAVTVDKGGTIEDDQAIKDHLFNQMVESQRS